MPHDVLFTTVWKCVELNEDIPFKHTIGMRVDNVLVLLKTYLKSTFISFDNRLRF